MEIEQHIWGATAEGGAVILYTMRSEGGAEVQICNVGASIVSIKVPDRDGRLADVALGYKNFESYMFDPSNIGKTIGRVANRIAGGRMTVDGKEYQLEINSGANHLHGGSKGFGRRVWEASVETNRLVMSLLSEDGDQGYPGELNVEAVFDLDDDNSLEITYLAKADRATVVDLTNHVYFNLSGENSGTVLDHELQLCASKAMEMDTSQIPTGRMIDVAGTPLDFRSPRSLGDGIGEEFNGIKAFNGYDHPFAVDGWKKNILTQVGKLRDPASGRTVTILTSQPCVMLYTGNRLAAGCPETKSGGRYADYDGVAIECQNFPDAVNRPELPSPLLDAGELYCQKIVYHFGTDR